MKKILILSLALSMVSSTSFAAIPPKFVTHIFNNWSNGKVTIKSTDPNAGPIVYQGTRYTNKNNEFDVNNISSINYVVPHELEGKIIITVYDNDNKIISSATLSENKHFVYGHERGGRVTLEKLQGPVKSYAGTIDSVIPALNNLAIMVDAQGTISLPRLLTITFTNGTGALLNVGSPDCSLASIDKAYTYVSSNPVSQHSITTLFNLNNCKFVATTVGFSILGVPAGSQATLCMTENWKKTDQCTTCSTTASGDYVCCDTDPFTGENVCNSEGITWVRGRTGSTETHVWLDYSVIPRKKS